MADNFISLLARDNWDPINGEKQADRNLWITDQDRMHAAGHSYTAINEMANRHGYTWGVGAKDKIEGHIERNWNNGAQGNWMTSYMGNEGFIGLPEYSTIKAAGRTDQEISDAFDASKVKIGKRAKALNEQNLAKALADKQAYEENISNFQEDLNTQMEEFKASIAPPPPAAPPTIRRSGNPGAVGKPAAGMRIAQGTDYSGGNRGLSRLNRDSAYFMNNLGGVNSSTRNNSSLNIA